MSDDENWAGGAGGAGEEDLSLPKGGIEARRRKNGELTTSGGLDASRTRYCSDGRQIDQRNAAGEHVLQERYARSID